jgi:ribonuclease-3
VSARGLWAETQLRYAFKDTNLLDLALTHRSASKTNNERLEYLGDSFLNFAIARRLFELRSDDTEGDLSRARAALVKEPTLAAIGQHLGIDAHLTLGAGELRTGGAQRAAILADAVEALIGAVLLDGGVAAAEAVVHRMFAERLESLPDAAALKDPKTRLQEWLQGKGLPLPSYAVTAVQGRDHEQTFVVECEVRDKEVRDRNVQTIGRGQSRRRAEQDAAAAMLVVLTGEQL